MKTTENTSNESIEIKITGFNLSMLNALCKYAQMLDHVTNSQGDEQLNVDGVINTILNDGMLKEIKRINKQHGFIDVEDFITSMSTCRDGEEVANECRIRESLKLKTNHDRILSQIPIDDKQCKIKFDDCKK